MPSTPQPWPSPCPGSPGRQAGLRLGPRRDEEPRTPILCSTCSLCRVSLHVPVCGESVARQGWAQPRPLWGDSSSGQGPYLALEGPGDTVGIEQFWGAQILPEELEGQG